jgi:hypothetical protein
MPDPIVTLLQDMANDTVVAKRAGSFNLYGEPQAQMSTTFTSCRITCKNRLVRNAQGTETTSTCQVTILDSAADLSARLDRFDLPARFSPNSNLEAISVDPVTDENGVHHTVVFLP